MLLNNKYTNNDVILNNLAYFRSQHAVEGKQRKLFANIFKDKGLDNESKPMANLETVYITGTDFLMVFGKMKQNPFFGITNEDVVWVKKQGIRFAVEMIGLSSGVYMPSIYLIPNNYRSNFDILK